ncbi:hypothetical protein JVU11DRAFT_5191 [Chiua virens]|nr:hypothetical protein JVU11DRAFT_5191 [Chiua virens]
MAALAFHHTRSFFSTFALPWLTRPTSAPTSWSRRHLLASRCPSFSPFLSSFPQSSSPSLKARSPIPENQCAVPTRGSRTSKARHIVNCPACGGAKLAHHACRSCYDAIIAKSKQQSKSSGGARSILSNTLKAAERSSS